MRRFASLLAFGFGLIALPADSAQQLRAEGNTPGQSITIRDLVRDQQGNLTLRFMLVNDSPNGISGVMLRERLDDAANKPSGVKLVDEATQTEYRPMRGADGQCVCSEMPNTGQGERANLWVRFNGVPPSVNRVTVEVKAFEPVSGVPITGP
jgi:hypothetical protein